MYKTLDAPLSAHLEVNTGCNQRCVHCYNFWRGDTHAANARLTPEDAARVVDQLARHGVFHAILNGGEPLMETRFLVGLMRDLTARSISFGLNSNLSLIDARKAEDLYAAGLRTILTSLLSWDAATHDRLANDPGSHARIVRGIALAQAAGINVSVNMVVMRPNLTHVHETGLLASRLGARSFSATRVMRPRAEARSFDESLLITPDDARTIVAQLLALRDTGLTLGSLIPYPSCFLEGDEELTLLGNRTCSAGKTAIAIGSDGSVRACTHHERVYGSLLTEDLGAIWSRMNDWRDGSKIPQSCKSCALVASCGGGCRFASLGDDLCGEDAIMREAVTQPNPYVAPTSDIVHASRLRVRRSCRFRHDSAVGIVNTGGMMDTFVTHDTFQLLSRLHGEQLTFTPQELAHDFGVVMPDHALHSFLGNLVRKHVLEHVA